MPGRHPPQSREDPHEGQPLETAGAPPQAAEAAVVMLHGRGSTAKHVLRLADEFYHHGVVYLAPQAAGSSWYPRSGFGPSEANEPWLSSALDRVAATLAEAEAVGVGPAKTLLFGFSQGGCLAAEYAARNPRRYGGLAVLSGGLLGPETEDDYDGKLDGTPVFLGCGDDDPYVPAERVRASAGVFERLGGDVIDRLYPDLGHAINDDEIRMVDSLVADLV